MTVSTILPPAPDNVKAAIAPLLPIADGAIKTNGAWLNSATSAVREQLEATPWPTRKTEAFKYTSLFPLISDGYFTQFNESSPASNAIDPERINAYRLELDTYMLVFINGQWHPELSAVNTDEFGITPFADADASQQAIIAAQLQHPFSQQKHLFAQINTALLSDGTFIDVPANTKVSKPIYILQLHTDDSASDQNSYHQQRIVLRAQQGSECIVIENRDHLQTTASSLSNVMFDISVEANANMQHISIQLEPETAVATSGWHITQHRDSQYAHYLVATGGQLKRNNIQVDLSEPGAHAELHGVYLCKHTQHIDNQTCLEHQAPHCTSEEHYRGLIADKGKATFNGRVHIFKDAQKTFANMNNKNLLLSKQAEINTKPELEIYADDVKCAHGATIGQLDDTALFYFQSRGIDKDTAQAMLCFGFVNTMIDELPIAAVQDYVTSRLGDYFNDVERLTSLWDL